MKPGRRAWMAGAGAAAAAAGLGLAWWHERPAAGPHPLFSARFDGTGDAPPLVMSTLLGQPLVLNFWATWCPPCVREMPLLDAFWRVHRDRGWQVAGLAADSAPAVREFLQRHPVGFPIGLAGFPGIALSRELGNEGGGLPFTVCFDAGGRVHARHVGELAEADLLAWVNDLG